MKPLVEKGYSKDAVLLLESVIKSFPQDADAYEYLSSVYASLKDKKSALKALDRMVEAIPSLKSKADEDRDYIQKSL